jgi:predicted TIM-barrel fold metal-dependent hydrolase
MGMNDIIRAMFEGYKDVKHQNRYRNRFEEMKTTNLLFDVDDVNDMINHAETKEEFNTILDHMYRFNATEEGPFGYYERLERKIINKMWEG